MAIIRFQFYLLFPLFAVVFLSQAHSICNAMDSKTTNVSTTQNEASPSRKASSKIEYFAGTDDKFFASNLNKQRIECKNMKCDKCETVPSKNSNKKSFAVINCGGTNKKSAKEVIKRCCGCCHCCHCCGCCCWFVFT